MHKDLVVNLITGQGLLPKCRSFKVATNWNPGPTIFISNTLIRKHRLEGLGPWQVLL